MLISVTNLEKDNRSFACGKEFIFIHFEMETLLVSRTEILNEPEETCQMLYKTKM